MRLIDVDEIKLPQGFFEKVDNVPKFYEWLGTLPTVEAEPIRHGHWIKRTKVHPDLPNDSTYNYQCSNCSYMDTHGADVKVPYCWHCGAKMDAPTQKSVGKALKTLEVTK